MLGAILGGASLGALGLAGDLIAGNQQRKWQEGQNNAQRELDRQQMEMQREFAQKGIQWKVEDAKAAGLHPLAALGAAGAGYNPVTSIMQNSYDPGKPYANMAERMGQNIQRAVQATQTPQERQIVQLDIERKKKENDLIQTQIDNAKWELRKNLGSPGIPKGYQYFVNPNGSISMERSTELANSQSGDLFAPILWNVKNKLATSFLGREIFNQPSTIVVDGKKYRNMGGDYYGPYHDTRTEVLNVPSNNINW